MAWKILGRWLFKGIKKNVSQVVFTECTKPDTITAILKYLRTKNRKYWTILYQASNPKQTSDHFKGYYERLPIRSRSLSS